MLAVSKPDDPKPDVPKPEVVAAESKPETPKPDDDDDNDGTVVSVVVLLRAEKAETPNPLLPKEDEGKELEPNSVLPAVVEEVGALDSAEKFVEPEPKPPKPEKSCVRPPPLAAKLEPDDNGWNVPEVNDDAEVPPLLNDDVDDDVSGCCLTNVSFSVPNVESEPNTLLLLLLDIDWVVPNEEAEEKLDCPNPKPDEDVESVVTVVVFGSGAPRPKLLKSVVIAKELLLLDPKEEKAPKSKVVSSSSSSSSFSFSISVSGCFSSVA